MFEALIQKFIVGITVISISIAGLFGYVPQNKLNYLEQQISALEEQVQNISFGSTNYVAGETYRLAGSGISSSATSIVLRSFNMPVSGRALAMTDFGSIGYATLEPGTSKKEFVSFTGVSSATLTGVVRGLNFVSPYTASTTLRQAHSGGSKLIISNPPQLWARQATLDNDETIQGDWTFSATNTPQYNQAPSFTSGSNEFGTVKLIEDTANQGAAISSEVAAGIVEIVDSSELGAGTATGTTGAILVLQNRFATSTGEVATSSIVVSESDGNINQGFLDLTEDFAFSGDNTLSGENTFTATTSLNATTTIGVDSSDSLVVNASTSFNAGTTFRDATTTFDRLPKIDSSSANATSTGFYHVATQGYAESQGINFANSTAFSGSSPAEIYADLDLSSIVGTNRALVYLKVQNNHNSGFVFMFRENGESASSTAKRGGTSQAEIAAGEFATLLVLTDASGVIEWKTTSVTQVTTIITVRAYFK